MGNKEERISVVLKIVRLANEWLDFVNGFGNECVYTDSIINSIKEKASELYDWV